MTICKYKMVCLHFLLTVKSIETNILYSITYHIMYVMTQRTIVANLFISTLVLVLVFGRDLFQQTDSRYSSCWMGQLDIPKMISYIPVLSIDDVKTKNETGDAAKYL